MVVQVHKSGDTYSFTLPPQAHEALALVDGDTIEIQRSIEIERSEEAVATPKIRYASVSEVMAVHRKMERHHAKAYSELAK